MIGRFSAMAISASSAVWCCFSLLGMPLDYRAEIDDLRSSEDISSPEFQVRLLLILVASVTGWLVLDLDILPIWFTSYLTAISIEKFLLWRFPEARTLWLFLVLIFVSFIIASTFLFLVLYLWFMDGSIWKFGATAILVAGCLNIFLLRTRVWQIATAYLIPVGIAVLTISASFFEPPSGGPAFWAAIVLAFCLIAYISVALREAYRLHSSLRDTQLRYVRAQKLEALGTLTGGIAHDFNNLLSVIQGNIELVKEYPELPDRESVLDDALQASHRGAELVARLLAYAKKSPLRPQNLWVSEVVSEVVNLTRRVLPENIQLSVNLPSEDLCIRADNTTLQAALLNLVVNAKDSMPGGGVLSLSVRALNQSADRPADAPKGEAAVFEIGDTGEGIPEDRMSRILDPFFSTKPAGQGSGLGLPMVAGFAEQSGGSVQIDSVEEQGTTVSIYLPVVRPPRCPSSNELVRLN